MFRQVQNLLKIEEKRYPKRYFFEAGFEVVFFMDFGRIWGAKGCPKSKKNQSKLNFKF